MKNLSPREKAEQGWGTPLPDWVEALVTALESNSQVKVAAQVQYSDAAISQTVRNIYTGDIKAVEDAVRVNLMGLQVACPQLGEIPVQECREHQKKPYSSNPQRLRMFRACKSCHNRSTQHAG